MSAHNTPYHMYQGPLLVDDPGDAGTIVIDRYGAVVPMVSAAAETRTLAVPTKAGILATLVMDTDGGDITLTVTSGYNAAGDTAIVFGDAGDCVTFTSVKIGANYRWRVTGQDGTDSATTVLTATSLRLAVNAVAAAGSAQGEGGDLLAGINVVSAADNTKCVDLPAAVAGTMVVVVSATAAKTLPIFPAVGSSIDNASANNAITLAAATAYSTAILFADNATHWVSVLGDSA